MCVRSDFTAFFKECSAGGVFTIFTIGPFIYNGITIEGLNHELNSSNYNNNLLLIMGLPRGFIIGLDSFPKGQRNNVPLTTTVFKHQNAQ